MPGTIQITYLNHSGFAVSVGETLLVFDDASVGGGGDDDASGEGVTRAMIDAHRRILFFVSHAHADHFNPHIYTFSDCTAYYILGDDVPSEYSGYLMGEGDSLTIGGTEITAYGSTDEGVSFHVQIDDFSIFHAGDLNLWHWREQSTLKEIEQAEREYESAVTPLIGKPIDFAFFPVDPRMGEMHDAGALHFLMNVKPRVFIPMHWWGRADVALEFARRNRSRRTEVIAMTKPGEILSARKGEDGEITIEM